MKSSKNILDYFKAQNSNLNCPACGILIQKSKLNIHLDSDCISSASCNKKLDNCPNSPVKSVPYEISLKTKKNTKMPSSTKITAKSSSSKVGRLSLKHQKVNASCRNVLSSLKCVKETEVITINEDSPSSVNNTETLEMCSETRQFNLKSQRINALDKHFSLLNSKKCDTESEVIILDENCSSLADDNIAKCDLLDTAEVKNKTMVQTNEQSNINLITRVKSESEFCCLIPVNNAEHSVGQNTKINNEQLSGEEMETKSVDTFLETHKTIEKINHHSLLVKNSYSSEDKNVTDPNCLHSKDSPIDMLPKTTEESESVNNTDFNAVIAAVLNDAEESVEADDNVFKENSENNQLKEQYSPYYIANFKHIVNTVLEDGYNKILFNDEDKTFIKAFETLPDAAQKLYVRLFLRKYKWLRLNKINYPNITKDPRKILDELMNAGLIDSGLDKIVLDTALDLLSLPEARILAKQFKFNLSGKSKTDITHLLLKHCKEHKSVFFCKGKNSISIMMLKKVKDILGPCYRISLLPKRLFTRILMLFSLPTISEDDDDAAGGQQQQLLTLLQVNKGEITFPDYKINRQMLIFAERDELIRYEEAKQLENDIMNAVESKNFELAKELYINAKEEFEDQLSFPFVERAASLPTFLKKYSSFHIYVRCMTQGVEILQRLRQYKEAVELLKRLLDQKVFCQDYRGRWWDRMALNLEQHLKQRQQALDAIKKGMKDKNVRKGYRYSLLTRALRILKTVEENEEFKNEIIEAANVIEPPKVVIKGRLFPRNILGRKHVFISSSSTLTDEDDITVLGVEQLAIEHYKNEGFTEGIHGESSTFHSLYGLLFWDIIYDGDIPDAFISPYQTHPLDLNHDSFFLRREKQILSHLEALRSSTIEELKEIVKSSWEAHFGQSSLVMWDRFTDVVHILGLVSCMGNNLLCGICERLARDFRFSRSGVPDLVVWNPESLQVKIVEVKGPGDKLSSKQILWLDYLLKLGAQAEVCHVEAVGSKKLRKE